MGLSRITSSISRFSAARSSTPDPYSTFRYRGGSTSTLLRREAHVPDSRMCQQLLPVLPENLLLHLRLELDLYRLKISHPSLRCNKRIIRPKQKTILQARSSFAQQAIRNVAR